MAGTFESRRRMARSESREPPRVHPVADGETTGGATVRGVAVGETQVEVGG